jgi:hypothetical protein
MIKIVPWSILKDTDSAGGVGWACRIELDLAIINMTVMLKMF